MKILMVHNFYRRLGGEDLSYAAERDLLRANGYDVETYEVDNRDLKDARRISTAIDTVWNRKVHDELEKVSRSGHFDIVHFQNTFPMISPAAYYAVRKHGPAVVQAIRNYRLACPNGLFFRAGKVCTDCRGKTIPWPSVLHACYRGSRPASAVVASMLVTHRSLGTFSKMVDQYIVLSEFQRDQLGDVLPSGRTSVKPNFVDPDPGPGSGAGGYAIYVGRLSQEKGIGTMLDAWESLDTPIRLKIVGDGPLAGAVANASGPRSPIDYLGSRGHDEVMELIGRASMLVIASNSLEGLPRTGIEAFSRGTPVVTARHSSSHSLVVDGETGATFKAGDPADLGRVVQGLTSHPGLLRGMRDRARSEFSRVYTGTENFQMLRRIYAAARASRADG